MATGQLREADIEIAAENVGGIDSTRVSLQPGVNVLEGRNASNRTSLLQAIMAALGSRRTTLKGDADEGRAALTVGEETYVRRLVRRDGGVVFDGEPYLEDPTVADLFAFLLESNEARRAVERGADLREIIMRPIDTDEIRAEIERLEAEKREIDDRLDELDGLAAELPDLEEQRTSLAETIERRESEVADLEARLAELEADEGDGARSGEDAEAAFEQLREARKDLDDVEFSLETERETTAELEAEREELRVELEELDGSDLDSPAELSGRIEELRERKRALDATVSELQSVIHFNEGRLDEGGIDLGGGDEPSAGEAVTDELVAGEAITCWTCGSEVERERVEETLERLRELHRERLEERNEVTDRIDELTSRQTELRERKRRRERLEERLESVDAELEAQAERIADLADEREALADRVATLEAETADVERDQAGADELVETHRELTQVELEVESHREQLAQVEERIEEVETRLADREDLAERREAVDGRLTDRRTRVDRLEAEAVEAFNEHVASILDVLGYDNVDRIWIERREREVREGRRTVTRTTFDLHVVRTTEGGATYEDTVEHLSESEREVTGLVFALAGYLVHDVHETVPFVLLDSLEAIDARRIADLVSYFEDYVDCLVVALLPEDAQALPDEYAYLTDI